MDDSFFLSRHFFFVSLSILDGKKNVRTENFYQRKNDLYTSNFLLLCNQRVNTKKRNGFSDIWTV